MIEIRPGADRFITADGGVESRHSFSFGAHYDPANVGFGLLVCHNDDVVQPGRGYATHPHRNLEIVTWVLEGELHHQDSTGSGGVVVPGLAQRLSAGSGVLHSEHAGPGRTRFVQMWLRPDDPDLPPSYQQAQISPTVDWCTVASGGGDGAVRIAARGAALHLAALRPGRSVEVPEAPLVHLFVCEGSVTLEGGGALEAGDAARLTDAGGLRIAGNGQVLAWAMPDRG